MNLLRRYWFKFEPVPEPTPLNLGCGITAFDYEDAVNILNKKIIPRQAALKIAEVSENVDVSLLDDKHVLPNIGSVNIRGVWFPKGYD